MSNMATNFKIDPALKVQWWTNKELQKTVCIEELGELIKELCKDIRGQGNRDKIIEELTDVLIMSQAIQLIYEIKLCEILQVKREKVKRSLERIESDTLF